MPRKQWYEGEREGLGTEFTQVLRATFARVAKAPLQFPLVFRDFRRAILRGFPFGVFFIVENDVVTVMAVTHLHRHSSVWQSRR